MIRTGSRSLAVVVVLNALALGSTAAPAYAQPASAGASPPAPSAGDAKTHLAAARKAAAAKDWTTALTEYSAAMTAAPTGAAMQGVADATYETHDLAGAYDAYDTLLKVYGKDLAAPAKKSAEARLKELAQKTGALTLKVSEPGAVVTIDDKPIGTTPVLAPVRVPVGSHKIRVTKEAFAPFEATKDVGGDARVDVDVTLTKAATTGHLVVKDTSGTPVRVVLDGVDVGAAPWEGDVAPGAHDVVVKSSTATAPRRQVDVAQGKTIEVTTAATASNGAVEFSTSDGYGTIYLDGKLVGEGSFKGDLPTGAHELLVKREGYADFQKQFDLKERQTLSEVVTLHRAGEGGEQQAAVDTGERFFGGVYGGIAALGMMEPGGEGNSLDIECNRIGASSCDTGNPLGGGLVGWFGYTWNPVGIELFAGATYDHTAPKAFYDGVLKPGTNQVTFAPTHTETFDIHRIGGIGAARVRLTLDGPVVRVTAAIGVGLAWRRMFLERKTTGADQNDRFVPDSAGYVSPAMTGDIGVHIRLAKTTALALGVFTWFENAENVQVQPEPGHTITSGGHTFAMYSQPYFLANSTQIFVGPYAGLAFGP